MVTNVNQVPSARFLVINKPPDEEPVSEIHEVVKNVFSNPDSVEISNEAHTASINSQVVNIRPATREFMEVFSVNIWSLGLEEQKQ